MTCSGTSATRSSSRGSGFVEQGLASGGQVLVHGTQVRVAMLRTVLGGGCSLLPTTA